MFPNTQNPLPRIAEILTKTVNGVIILPSNPSIDAIAAGTALYLGLIKQGKNVALICSSLPKSDLIGSDKIQNSLTVSGDNLVISFPYTDGAIDKIDYQIQGDKFNLIVTPRQGYPKLNPQQVSYSYSGGTFDFIITIDAPNLNALGSIYTDNQTQFQGKEIINIDRHLTNAFFGTANFVNKSSSSTSELVYKVLQQIQCDLDRDIATNLYAGIASATNTFTSYSVNAETFETIAQLLKAGAAKKPISPLQQQTRTSFSSPSFQSHNTSTFSPSFSFKQPGVERQQTQTIQSVESQESQSKEGAKNPQDWLKPKIFKGGGLV